MPLGAMVRSGKDSPLQRGMSAAGSGRGARGIMRKNEVCALAVIIGLALVVGLFLGPKAFAQNLLSSTVDIGVSIFIALYLIDRISQRERKRKWSRVRDVTYDSVESICGLIGDELERVLSIGRPIRRSPRPDGRPLGSLRAAEMRAGELNKQRFSYEYFEDHETEILRRIEELSKIERVVEVDESLQEMAGGPSEIWEGDGLTVRAATEEFAAKAYERMLNEASSRELYDAIIPYVQQLTLHIYPRVIELDEDAELTRALIALDSSHMDWSSTVDLVEEWGAPEKFAWESAAHFCGCAAAMLRIMHQARCAEDRHRPRYQRGSSRTAEV